MTTHDAWALVCRLFAGGTPVLRSTLSPREVSALPVLGKAVRAPVVDHSFVLCPHCQQHRAQVWSDGRGGRICRCPDCGLFFSYKTNRISSFINWSIGSAVVSVALAFAIAHGMDIHTTGVFGAEAKIPFISPFFLLLVVSLFTVFSSLSYMLIVLKGRWSASGGSVAHLGFGIFQIGVLLSQYKMQLVSLNEAGINFGKGFDGKEQLENILLVKDSTYNMAGYEITYTGRRAEKNDQIYSVDYVRKTGAKITEKFTLTPYVVTNKKMGNSSNPSAKHYLTKDIFRHIVAAADYENAKDTTTQVDAAVGDTFYLKSNYVVFESVDPKPKVDIADEGKLAVAANLKISDCMVWTKKQTRYFL